MTPARADEARRRELLRGISLVGMPLALGFSLWYAAHGAVPHALISGAVGTSNIGIVAFARRPGTAFRNAGVVGLVTSLLGMTLAIWDFGGFASPVLLLCNVPPMIAYFALGRGPGSIVFAAAFAILTAATLFAPTVTATPDVVDDLRHFMPLASLAATFGLTIFFERGRERAFTLLTRANEELERARDEAQAASRAKSEFVAMVSHELRTPLHAIRSALDLLQTTALDAAQRENLRIAAAASTSLSVLFEDLLDLSRLDAQRLELRPAPVDVVEIARGAVDLLSRTAATKGIRLEAELPPNPTRVIIDAGRAQQVIVNLLDNAVKFTSEGSVKLRLEARERGSLADVEVTITDSGIGVDPKVAAAIFDRFRQGDGSRTRRYAGVGLGLAIARELTRMMGGDVELLPSSGGPGAAFRARFSVPIAAETGERHGGLASARFLVVEDNIVNQRLTARMLEVAGASAAVASDGAEAMRIAGERSFDAILMDLYMPGVDGFRATAELRALGVRVPILATTAGGTAEDIAKALAAGADEVLLKPIDVNAIAAALGRLAISTSARAATGQQPSANAPKPPQPERLS